MATSLDFTKVDWYEVLPKFGIDKKFLRKVHGPCPLCDGSKKNRRFRFSNKEGLGEWFCSHCLGGNALTLLRRFTGRSDAEILKEIQEQTGLCGVHKEYQLYPKAEMSKEEIEKNRSVLVKAWTSSVARCETDIVSTYLHSRVPGSKLNYLSKNIRLHKGMKYFELNESDKLICKGIFPVLLAKVVDSSGLPITLHRIYLTRDGTKAPFEKVKKQMSGIRKLEGASIHLIEVPANRTVGICEGIETGWAIATAYRYSMSVWALLNAVNLSVADIPRSKFDKVIIFADHDRLDLSKGWCPGEHFANIAKQKLEKEGFEVEIRLPPVEETDFCDLWVQHYNSFKKAA